jgi:hypothetical protein
VRAIYHTAARRKKCAAVSASAAGFRLNRVKAAKPTVAASRRRR